MLPEKRNLAINWIDGMKLNKDHFIHHDNWILEKIRESSSIGMTDFNYGLVKNAQNTSLGLKINIDQNHQINIQITDCCAITSGGITIEISSQNIQTLQYPFEKLSLDFNISESANEMFDIILAVFPQNRIPVGLPDENERPFRHPFTMPEYCLSAVPTKQVNSSQMWKNHITIGKFQVIAKEVNIITEYIPPCTSIAAYPALSSYYTDFGNISEKILAAFSDYLRKNRSSQAKIESNLCFVVEKMAYYLTMNLSYYKLIIKTLPPLFMIEFFIQFARLFKSVINWLNEYEREEMHNHLSHWVSYRDLENAAFELIELQYDHQHIHPSIIKVEKFLNLMLELFEKIMYSGKVAPVKETKVPVGGPIIIKDGKRIN
jgi:hypothetical protein